MFMGSQSDRTDWEGGSTKGKAPLNKSKRIAIVGSSLALVLLCLFFFAGGKGADFHSRMPFHLGRDSTLPRVELSGRVLELLSGEHFDDILKDTPDDMRPPSLIAFYGFKTCPKEYAQLEFQKHAEETMPSRERLFAAKYDIDANPARPWFKWTPERDLAKRLGVTRCPEIVYAPRSCNGLTEWCMLPNHTVGCDDFKESCKGFQSWDGTGSWTEWAQNLIDSEPEPMISHYTATYERQAKWLRGRETVTTGTHMRNYYLPLKIPNFTETGSMKIDCPDELYDALIAHHDKQTAGRIESWGAISTQNSFHATKTFMYDVHMAPGLQRLAIATMKPILEEWSGVSDLQFSSFYGIREYYPGHFLRNHVDRTDALVISATICVDKRPIEAGDDVTSGHEGDPWPLEVVDWDGNNVRHAHQPKKILLYESSKLIHGRPTPNPVGTHLGAFIHFKPPASMKWPKVSQAAQHFLAEHQSHVQHRTKSSKEPEHPIFTEVNYGDGSTWDCDGAAAATIYTDLHLPPPDVPVRFNIYFYNGMKRNMVLWFLRDDDDHDEDEDERVIQCGPFIKPGDQCGVNTFPGHSFIWSLGPHPEGSTDDHVSTESIGASLFVAPKNHKDITATYMGGKNYDIVLN